MTRVKDTIYSHVLFQKRRDIVIASTHLSIRPLCYLLLNHLTKSNQICCVSYSHEWVRVTAFFFAQLHGQKVKNHFISITKSISQILYQTLCVFLQIKDIKHIEQNCVAWVMFQGRDFGVLGAVTTFGVGICDGAPLTAHSSFCLKLFQSFSLRLIFRLLYFSHLIALFYLSQLL